MVLAWPTHLSTVQDPNQANIVEVGYRVYRSSIYSTHLLSTYCFLIPETNRKYSKQTDKCSIHRLIFRCSEPLHFFLSLPCCTRPYCQLCWPPMCSEPSEALGKPCPCPNRYGNSKSWEQIHMADSNTSQHWRRHPHLTTVQ